MSYLKEFLSNKNITQKKLIEDLNVSQAYVSGLLSGKKSIGKKMALKLHELYGVDISKVLFKEDDQLFNVKTVFSESDKKNMMVVPLKAYGGFLSGYESQVYLNQLEKVSFPMVRGECFAFEIEGFSMVEYNPGDYFIGTRLESFKDLVKGRHYVFQTVDGLILKKFESIEDEYANLSSTNKDYNPIKPIHLKDIKVIYHKEAVIKF